MKIDVLTLFPEMFSLLNESVIGRAIESGVLSVHTHNIRDYSASKHKTADDYPFGGGAGMVMAAQPVFDCYETVIGQGTRTIYMSPRGRVLTSELAMELAKEDALAIICGHYEGIDERVMGLVDDEISIGDYVLTGGELPAMVMIDALARFVKGVISETSIQEESFGDGLLEYPQYTRPAVFRNECIPEVLLSGHHKNIELWRRQQSLAITAQRRPDLLKKAKLSASDKDYLAKIGFFLQS